MSYWWQYIYTLGKIFEVWGTWFVPLCTPNLWMYPHVPHFLMGTCTPLCTPFEIQCCDQTDLLTNSGILCDSLRVSLCTLLIRVSLSQFVGSPLHFLYFAGGLFYFECLCSQCVGSLTAFSYNNIDIYRAWNKKIKNKFRHSLFFKLINFSDFTFIIDLTSKV